ncbi:hypothetical protein V1504DRAFT_118294 [Lipomyces starkeyi]
MEKKFRDMNLDIMMVYGKKVIVVVDTDIQKDGTGNIQTYIINVFGGSGYTDCSDPTVSAIPTSSNTQMKELRDYICWYTRDHLTQIQSCQFSLPPSGQIHRTISMLQLCAS